MDLSHATNLMIEYRYWILVPLSVIEGPVVAFVAGTLAYLGYFNIWVLAIFLFFMDLAKDAFYYSLGHWGGKSRVARYMLKRIGVQEDHLDEIRGLWEMHAGKTMFLGKLSYGIAATFVALAGTVGMPLGKFFKWAAVVAITQYWTLLFLGYFFGRILPTNSASVIETIFLAIGGITLMGSVYYITSHFIRKIWKKEIKEEERFIGQLPEKKLDIL